MKIRKFLLAAGFCLPMAFVLPASAAEAQQFVKVEAEKGGEAVTLKAKLNLNKKYTVRQKMKTAMPIPAGAGEMKMDMTYDTHVKVLPSKEKEGHKEVSVGFDRVAVSADMAGQLMEYDSADEAKQNPMLKMSMEPMTKMKFKALYNANDEFVDVLEAPAAAGGGMGMGMGEAEIRQIIESMVNHGFPEKAVKVGDTWTHEMDVPMGQMGGEMTSKTTYTYKGKAERNGKKYPKFSFNGTIGGEAGAGGNALIEFKDSSIKGWMLFDEEHGLVRYSEMDMDLTMAVGGADGAELDTSTKAVVELVKIEDIKAGE